MDSGGEQKHAHPLIVGFVFVCGMLALISLGRETNFGKTILTPDSATYISESAVRLYASIYGTEKMKSRYYSAAQNFTIIAQHEMAHLVGRIAYGRSGLEALAICGTEFNYGCVHEVLGLALEDKGASAQEAIDAFIEACRKQTNAPFGPCAHGIGHGLTYLSAYQPEALGANLKTCDRMHADETNVSATQSCYTGIFMEYNERFMRSGPARRYEETAWFAPCDALSEPLHIKMCVFWQIPWMHGVRFGFSYAPETFSQLGDYCLTAPTDVHDTCVMSVGRSIGINASMPPERVQSLCEAAFKAQADQDLCIFRAAYSYRGEGNRNDADTLCSFIRERHTECDTYDGTLERGK